MQINLFFFHWKASPPNRTNPQSLSPVGLSPLRGPLRVYPSLELPLQVVQQSLCAPIGGALGPLTPGMIPGAYSAPQGSAVRRFIPLEGERFYTYVA